MKRCPKCNHINKNKFDTCEKCGQGLWNVPAQDDPNHPELEYDEKDSVFEKIGDLLGNPIKKAQDRMYDRQVAAHAGTAAAQRMEANESSDQFVDASETAQATLGSGSLKYILSGGSIERGAAILTEQRLYYFGKSFSSIGTNTTATTEESIIPVSEITLTRFVHRNPVGRLVSAALCLALALFSFVGNLGSTSSNPIISMMSLALFSVSVVLFVLYFSNRSTILEIAFPGGRFCFDARWHSITDMRNFQQHIHLAKDRLKSDRGDAASEKVEAQQ